MKKIALFLTCFIFTWHTAQAADLVEVYRQALSCDPTFQRAIAQRFATQEGVPISISSLLPNVIFTGTPSVTRSAFSGSAFTTDPTTGIPLTPRNNTVRAYTMALTATQTVFNFAQFSAVAGQIAISKQADATLNAALQDLMVRVARAYFAILQDEDNLSFNEATKLAFAEQLEQVRQQYNVGLKTITEVYTAEASYDSSVANYVAAETALYNDRENLRVITGKYYPYLEPLSENFPLLSPQPSDINVWVDIAQQQNWSIKASQYDVSAKKQYVRQQFAGHLPTVNIQGILDRQYNQNINGYTSIVNRSGPATQTDRQLLINVNVPIFTGGSVVALTNQAVFNYEAAQQNLEYTVRSTVNLTRQSYRGIIAGISQINAGKQAIRANKSSLSGMDASFQVGTTTLVDVLNQQQKLFQAQTKYATDRYAFINNIFQLKLAAGTLSFEDVCAINAWLIKTQRKNISPRKFVYLGDKTTNKTVKKIVARKISRKEKAITISQSGNAK